MKQCLPTLLQSSLGTSSTASLAVSLNTIISTKTRIFQTCLATTLWRTQARNGTANPSMKLFTKNTATAKQLHGLSNVFDRRQRRNGGNTRTYSNGLETAQTIDLPNSVEFIVFWVFDIRVECHSHWNRVYCRLLPQLSNTAQLPRSIQSGLHSS